MAEHDSVRLRVADGETWELRAPAGKTITVLSIQARADSGAQADFHLAASGVTLGADTILHECTASSWESLPFRLFLNTLGLVVEVGGSGSSDILISYVIH